MSNDLRDLLASLSVSEKAELDRLLFGVNLDNLTWRQWLAKHFPRASSAPMPETGRHAQLWEWFEKLTPGTKPRPRVEVWPRGGGKSTSVELGVVRTGERLKRRFALYVSETQGQANKHVTAVATKFEVRGSGRAVGKYGNSKGWKIDLLRCENGFNVLALGLDAAARGVKLDDYRPDLIIFDDIDSRHDSAETIQKKVETITESILPSGSIDCAVLFVQNKVHRDSIVSQLVDSRADFLLDREVPTVEPAVYGLKIGTVEQPDGTRRYKIIEGQASWDGQSLETCERQLNEWGRGAFLREAQHDVDEVEDGLWQRQRDIDPFRAGPGYRFDVPQLDRVVVGVDPPRSTGQCGIVAEGRKGIGPQAHYYTLEDATPPADSSTATWCKAVIDTAERWKADAVIVETNYGGRMVKYALRQTKGGENLKIIEVVATRGKLVRAEPVQGIDEEGRGHHCGVFVDLERELCTYKPGDESPNRLDAKVWARTALMKNIKQEEDEHKTYTTFG